jgi:hypothetical protein
MNVTHISQHQTQYSLAMYKCLPLKIDGVQIDNLVYFTVERPFILLHAFTVRKIDDRDRYSDLSQGMTNALLYLDPHPVVQVAQVANITSFHIAAGQYQVQDLRPEDGEVDGLPVLRSDYDQYVFVLLCTNF